MVKISKWLSSIMLITILAGCQPPTVAEHPGYMKQSTLDESHPEARLILGTKSLVGEVRMANVRLRKVGTLTQAQIGIQNLSNKRYHLEYKVEWEDASGFMVEQSGVWRPFILAPTQIETIRAVGKVPEARKIVITLRNPDNPFTFEGKKELRNPFN